MIRSTCCTVFIAFGALAVGYGQEAKDAPKTPQTKKPAGASSPDATAPSATAKNEAPMTVAGDVLVHFLNGSVVRMMVESEKLDIATPYGRLAVPIKDVRHIEFGLHFPEGVGAQIDAAIDNLGSRDFRSRDKASKALIEFGPLAYPAALQACASKELEVSRRAKEVVKAIETAHAKKDLKTSSEDKLVTPTFTIVGRILTPSVKAKTELFGQVELSIAKMQTLKAMIAPGAAPRELTVTVDAAKYANVGQWLETAYECDGKTKLLITATGLIDTWPQQPGQWMAGPAGGGGGGGGRIVLGGNFPGQPNPLIGSALFGKIGQNGQPFMIGARYEGAPETEGKLYLHIAPSMWGGNSTGTFTVKIAATN